MWSKLIVRQTKSILKQWEAVLTMTILFWLIGNNFLENVIRFRGMDVVVMYHPMKLLTLSYNKTNYRGDIMMMLVTIYPFLAVLPAGFSYAKEQQTGEEVYLTARLGKKNYMFGKLWASFFATVIVFFIPFFLEILANCLSFPMKAQNDFYNMSIYSAGYAEKVHRYIGDGLYIFSPVLYAAAGTLFFCIMTGIMGMLTVAVSFCFRVKFRLLLFLPVYLLLGGSEYLAMALPGVFGRTRWYTYVQLFEDNPKQIWHLAVGIFVLMALIWCFYVMGKKRENL